MAFALERILRCVAYGKKVYTGEPFLKESPIMKYVELCVCTGWYLFNIERTHTPARMLPKERVGLLNPGGYALTLETKKCSALRGERVKMNLNRL